MPTLVHFEIPADDVKRARTFYTKLFDWKIETAEGYPDYWYVTTTGENAVHGGMMERQDPQQQIAHYIDVPSVSEYVEKIEDLGGRILVPKTVVPGMGYMAMCLDTEHNVFGIWEEDKSAE